MQYRESPPSQAFAGRIKSFWSLEYEPEGHEAEAETVLPDGCPEIVFNLSDRFRYVGPAPEGLQPATLFAGQMSRSIAIKPTGKVRLFGVRFHPAGAFALGGFPMHELTDRIVSIDSALGRAGSELESRVLEADGFQGRIHAFESHFLNRLVTQKRQDPVAERAAAVIVGNGGSVSIAGLAETLGVSERRLERRFRSRVGLSPKMLARIVRFQGVVRKVQRPETPDMLDAVHDLGYFDQSHMIRDFREFSGETPLGYFERTHSISDMFTGS